jgi:hypothetical protein
MKNKHTAMQQLLNQMMEERTKLPLPIEWDRCYQAIEMMIKNTYIPMEKEQINKACYDGYYQEELYDVRKYYNDTYGGNK